MPAADRKAGKAKTVMLAIIAQTVRNVFRTGPGLHTFSRDVCGHEQIRCVAYVDGDAPKVKAIEIIMPYKYLGAE